MKKILFVFILLLFLQSNSFAQTTNDWYVLYNEGKYDQVIHNVLEALKADPKNIEYNLLLGRTYTDMLQFETALTYLNKANIRDKQKLWVKAWALDYLGRCCYGMGNYKKSKKSLDECISLNATKNATNDSLSLKKLFGFNKYFEKSSLVETEHFIFHFPKQTKVNDIQQYANEREAVFRKINQFFNGKIPVKINFYVYNSDEDMEIVFSKKSGFARPNLCLVHSRYFQTLGHEMTHIISYYYDRPIAREGLINEGIAVYFDQINCDKLLLARESIKSKGIEISIKELWNNWALLSDDISYPLAGAFVKYLIDQEGENKFKLIIANQSYQNAKSVYGDKLDILIKGFEEELLKGLVDS